MKKWVALLLAVLMLCTLVGCGDKAKPDDKDTPTTTTTTKQEIVPIELVEGEIPSDCYWTEDVSAPARNMAVMIKANVNLTDVQWLALNPDPPTMNQVLDHRALKKGEIWTVNTYINDAVPNRGIACVDESGKTYYYAIAWSGKDGSISLSELNIEALSEERLTEVETMLNAEENNGFVSMNEYSCPEEVSLFDALYGGAGIGVGSWEWTEEEVQDYIVAAEWEELYTSVLRFAKADVEALLQKRLGISLADLTKDIDMVYIEKYDAYYHAHSDTQYQPVEVLSGWLEGGEGGLFVVDYKIGWSDDAGRVTLKQTKDGYQFVSNVEISEAINTIHLSKEQLEKINTFLNDPDNLGFVQRSFDRPEEVKWSEVLTADVTFGVDEREWSDAERQALSDALEYDMSGSPIRYPRAKVEELFQKRLGIPLSALETPISAVYLAEYDAYYRSFLGIEWVPVYVKSGKIENGIYIVDYEIGSGEYVGHYRVTMRATADGFQFISNVSIEN